MIGLTDAAGLPSRGSLRGGSLDDATVKQSKIDIRLGPQQKSGMVLSE